MKNILYGLCLVMISSLVMASPAPPKYYELRIYHCNEGKLDNLLARFRDHTTRIFEKHGMENIGYWTPTKEGNLDLYYILAFPSKEARDASWKAFGADSEWKEVAKKSEEGGKIIKSIESSFMTLKPELTKKIDFKNSGPNRLFEMRTYQCFPDKYPNIVARFKDHTRKLFKKHGIENIMYFETLEKDGAQAKLLYFIATKDENAAKKSWASFRADPKWIKAKEASEASGKIVEKSESVFMIPTDFSKIK